MKSDLLDSVKERFANEGADPGQYSPLSLAFIGDSIYGAIVKTAVVLEGNCPANTHGNCHERCMRIRSWVTKSLRLKGEMPS